MEKVKRVNYKKIYNDIIMIKYPEKIEKCRLYLEKDHLTSLDIIHVNTLIFGQEAISLFNSKHRSYSKDVIFEILEYQKKNNLNNSQLALHFSLSRNTVTKWRKLFYSIIN